MKRIMKKLKIMALCILTATCSSCLDMLDKTPISQLSVGKLFETADGAEAARIRMLQFPQRNRILQSGQMVLCL